MQCLRERMIEEGTRHLKIQTLQNVHRFGDDNPRLDTA